MRRVVVVIGLLVVALAAWAGIDALLDTVARRPELAVVLARGGDSIAPAGSAFARVRGRVIDVAGAGVAGARVLGDDCRGRGLVTTTGADGRFEAEVSAIVRLGAPWPGRPAPLPETTVRGFELWMSASGDGFCGSSLERLDLVRDATLDGVVIRLWRGGFVAGRVVDRSGAAVAAEITARTDEPSLAPLEYAGRADLEREADARADAASGFRLGPLPAGMYLFTATVPGQGSVEQAVAVAEGATNEVVLPLALTPHLSGRVVDAAGAPLADVVLVCRPEPGEVRAKESLVAPRGDRRGAGNVRTRPDRAAAIVTQRTGHDGAFWFGGLSTQARYAIGIAAAAGPRAAATLHGLVATTEELELVAPPPQELRGVVVDARGGAPVGGAVVRALPAAIAALSSFHVDLGRRLEGAGAVRSDAEGRFTLAGLMPGAFELQVIAPGFEVARRAVELAASTASVAPTAAAPLRIELVAAPSLHGRLLDRAGAACAGGEIELKAVAPAKGTPGFAWTGVLRATSDAQGRFELASVPADVDLRLCARDGVRGVATADVRLTAGERRELPLRLVAPPRVIVRLLRADGDGLPGFPVKVRALDDEGIEAHGITDASGCFIATGLLPGRWLVAATGEREDVTRPEVAARRREVTLTEGDLELTLRAPNLTYVTGRVRVEGSASSMLRIGLGPLAGTPDHFEPLLFEVVDGLFGGLAPPGRYHVGYKAAGRRAEADEVLTVPDRALFEVELSVKFEPGS